MDTLINELAGPQATPAQDRKGFIGGSDAARVLGLSRYGTAYDVWLEKTGQTEPKEWSDDQARRLWRGKFLEPYIRALVKREHGIDITHVNRRFRDEEHAFLSCEIDFEWRVTEEVAASFPALLDYVGTTQNGEIKSVNSVLEAKAFGEAETDEIPIEYAVQSMHGLMITGSDVTLFGVLIGLDTLLPYFVYRAEDMIAMMRPKLVNFWTDHVLANVPPPAQTLEDLYRIYSSPKRPTKEASPELVELVRQYHQIGKQISQFQDDRDQLKFRVLEAIADAEVLTYCGKPIATWSPQQTASLDAERLKKESPETYERFVRRGMTRALRTKAKGLGL